MFKAAADKRRRVFFGDLAFDIIPERGTSSRAKRYSEFLLGLPNKKVKSLYGRGPAWLPLLFCVFASLASRGRVLALGRLDRELEALDGFFNLFR